MQNFFWTMHQLIFTGKKVAKTSSTSRINQLCEDTPQGGNPNPVQSADQQAKYHRPRQAASRHTATLTAVTQMAPSSIPAVPKIAFTWPSYEAPISQMPRFRLTPARTSCSAIWPVQRQVSRSYQDIPAGHPARRDLQPSPARTDGLLSVVRMNIATKTPANFAHLKLPLSFSAFITTYF